MPNNVFIATDGGLTTFCQRTLHRDIAWLHLPRARWFRQRDDDFKSFQLRIKGTKAASVFCWIAFLLKYFSLLTPTAPCSLFSFCFWIAEGHSIFNCSLLIEWTSLTRTADLLSHPNSVICKGKTSGFTTQSLAHVICPSSMITKDFHSFYSFRPEGSRQHRLMT